MARTPTMGEAEQASELLGVDVFDLAWAMRDAAEIIFTRETGKVRDFETPNFGRARSFLRAAQACDDAWREVAEAVEPEAAA
jgi:hypothetical protein